jgi:hypothetical protein
MANEINIDRLEFEPEHSNFLDDSISNFSADRKKTTPRVHGSAIDVNGDAYKVLSNGIKSYDANLYKVGGSSIAVGTLKKGDIVNGIKKRWAGTTQSSLDNYYVIEFTKDGKLLATSAADDYYFPRMYAKV